MSFWSYFVKNYPENWENKVVNDFRDKNISDFFWKTDYGEINPFSKTKITLSNGKSQTLDQIRWKFTSSQLLNKKILSRLNDGINSIYLKEIKFESSIFNKIMVDIIENHITLNPLWSRQEINLWTEWATSIKTGSLRLNPLSNLLVKYDEKLLASQLRTYKFYNDSFDNENLKCLYVPNNLTLSPSFEIAVLGAYLNELIELNHKNNIKIPNKIIIETSLNNNYIESIAKIISIRSIVSQIVQVHQLDVIIQIETSVNSHLLKEKDFDFRLMSITNMAMTSLLGGANSFELSDGLIKSNEEYWKKILVNIPLILKEESYLNNEMYKGAHIIEEYSFKLAQKAWKIFKEIETQNGLIAVIKSNQFSNYIQ